MKEVKLLGRVQAVTPHSIGLILATIQEYSLQSERICEIVATSQCSVTFMYV